MVTNKSRRAEQQEGEVKAIKVSNESRQYGHKNSKNGVNQMVGGSG